MRARPEVVADEAALRSQNLGVSLARLRRRLLPTLSLTAAVAPNATSKAGFTTAICAFKYGRQ